MKGLLFTYVLTYGGGLVSLFQPFVGLLIYICFAIVKPEALWYWSVPEGNYSRIVFIALFVGWTFAGFGSWRLGRAKWPAVALCVYLVWSAVSAFQASDQTLAWANVEAIAKIVLPVIVGLTLIDCRKKLLQVAWVIVLSQAYLALEFNLSYYSEFNRLVEVGFAGMEEKSVAIPMVIGAALAFFLALSAKRMAVKYLTLLAAALMVHVPLFTLSRGGMLALGVTAFAAILIVPKRPQHLILLALALAVGLRLAGPEVREKFSTTFASEEDRDASAQSRFQLWGQAWDTMLHRPLTGVGPRNWGKWSQSEYGWENAKEVHNTWLQTGAELGFPGLIALLLFFGLPALQCIPLARGRLAEPDPDIARMVVCALAGYGVASQFITVYGVEVPFYVAMVGAGLLKLRSEEKVREATPATVVVKPVATLDNPAPTPASGLVWRAPLSRPAQRTPR